MSNADRNEKREFNQLVRRAGSAWIRIIGRVRQTVAEDERDKYVCTRYGTWVLKKHVDQAFDLFKKVLEIDPNALLVRLDRGNAFDFLGRFEEGVSDLVIVSNIFGEDVGDFREPALHALAIGMLRLGRFGEAKEYSDRLNALILEGRSLWPPFDFDKELKMIRSEATLLVADSVDFNTGSCQENVQHANAAGQDTASNSDAMIEAAMAKIQRRLETLPKWQTGNSCWRSGLSPKELEAAELAIRRIESAIDKLQADHPDEKYVVDFVGSVRQFLT